MELSANFTLEECVKSQTALRQNIENVPDAAQVEALKRLAGAVLQPVRLHFGRAVFITSGFRCEALCRAIGSKPTSQHALGQAADFEIPGISNPDVAAYIRDELSFDQLILEYYDPEAGPNSGWVHCSYVGEAENRKQTLTINKSGTHIGLL
jgi:hypothetical protein